VDSAMNSMHVGQNNTASIMNTLALD